jgi:hypothetical protein
LLFPGDPEIAVTRIVLGFFQGEDLLGFRNQAGQSFADPQADLADRFRIQALRCPQEQGFVILVEEVQGAHIGMGTLGDKRDDIVQGLVEVMGLQDQGADVLQCAQAKTGIRFSVIVFGHVDDIGKRIE